ncbi:MAG: hypothetical protein J3K34DRAFT_265597 [Monoraphidium minutum]|nr:MAG: hypothetical protein J3K34DRAFT_265597 [Monoraphidium minutum]
MPFLWTLPARARRAAAAGGRCPGGRACGARGLASVPARPGGRRGRRLLAVEPWGGRAGLTPQNSAACWSCDAPGRRRLSLDAAPGGRGSLLGGEGQPLEPAALAPRWSRSSPRFALSTAAAPRRAARPRRRPRHGWTSYCNFCARACAARERVAALRWLSQQRSCGGGGATRAHRLPHWPPFLAGFDKTHAAGAAIPFAAPRIAVWRRPGRSLVAPRAVWRRRRTRMQASQQAAHSFAVTALAASAPASPRGGAVFARYTPRPAPLRTQDLSIVLIACSICTRLG